MLWAQYDFLHVAINKVLQLPRSRKAVHESGFNESQISRQMYFLQINEDNTASKNMEELFVRCLQNSAASLNCTAAINGWMIAR